MTTSAPEPAARPLPAFFEPLLARHYGADDVARVLAGSAVRRVSSLRANALKASRDQVAAALDAAGVAWRAVPWYVDAFELEPGADRAVRDLPAYANGELYLQGLSSMLPPLALGVRAGADVLDMCAAPGGKTCELAALSGGRARITACEMNAPRAQRLEHNLALQGASCVTVMRADARRLDDLFSFDQVLLDAPCSGSGTLDARDPKIAARFTPQLVQKSVRAQRALLSKALRLLKPGGTLVYSTCSVLPDENEQVVRACLKEAAPRGLYRTAPVELPGLDDVPRLPCDLPGALTVCPTERYEGFFVAKVVREA
jgi:ribosomal RNA methyltransferase Nop2